MDENLKNLALASSLDVYSSILSKNLKAINSVNTSLNGLTSISKALNKYPFKQSVEFNSIMGLSAIQSYYSHIEKQVNPLLAISKQLFQITKSQENIVKNVSSILSSNLTDTVLKSVEILKKTTIPDFSKTLSSIALVQKYQNQLYEKLPEYLSNSLDLYLTQEDNINIEEIENISDDLQNINLRLVEISENQKITKEDIVFIKTTLEKEETSAFVFFIIQIVLAILLSFSNNSTKQSNINITINNYEQKEIEKGFKETLELLCLETRCATANVNLRSKPSSNSSKIGIVPFGQIVIVQEINHKWIRIIFQDDEYMIQSGWVYKKYFERINSFQDKMK